MLQRATTCQLNAICAWACITPCSSLGNDEACVNVLRMVHAVIEGGGALVSVTRTWCRTLVTASAGSRASRPHCCSDFQDEGEYGVSISSNCRVNPIVSFQLNIKTPLLPMILALKLDAVVASRCHLRKKEEQESLQDDDCFCAVLFVPLVALGLFLVECSPEKQGGGA
jgi:hypothetical protein